MMKKMKNRLCAGILTVTMLLLLLPYTDGKASDLEGHWAATVMEEWVGEGFLTGYEDGNFYPDAYITRAEFMTLINRMQGYLEESEEVEKYTDVPPHAWYYRTVSRALKEGYVKGVNDTQMMPERFITRQEAIAVVNRIAGIDAQNADLSVLNKVSDHLSIAPWAKPQIAAAIRQGFVAGTEGKIEAGKNISRAEAVVLLNRKYKDIRTFSFPGEYSLGTVNGVLITSASVSLSDTIVQGDLEILLEGAGGIVTLNNVTVQKRLILNGDNIKLVQDEKTTAGEIVRRIQTGLYQDGTYIGKGIGYGGELSVAVTILDGMITSIVINKHSETPSYLRNIDKLFASILERQVSAVDTISGATRTSQGLIAAVEDALAQARGETTAPGQTAASQVSHKGSGRSGQTATKPVRIHYSGYIIEDGVFQGSANGYGGTLYVTVTVQDGQITAVEVGKNKETKSYLNAAMRLINSLIQTQSTMLDTVSGATKSSYAILSAVEDALKDHISKRAIVLSAEQTEILKKTGVLQEGEIMIAVQLPQSYQVYNFVVAKAENEKISASISPVTSDGRIVKLKTAAEAKYLTITNQLTGTQLLVFDMENGAFQMPAKQGVEKWTMVYEETEKAWFVFAQLLSGTAADYMFKVDGTTVTPLADGEDEKSVRIMVTEGTNKVIMVYNKNGSELLGVYTIVYENGHVSTGDEDQGVPAVSPALVADGTYEGSGIGFGGPIHVKVTVSSGVITEIEAGAHAETVSYPHFDETWSIITFGNTWNTITNAIKERNTTDGVDVISGATYTSKGIKDGVNDALSKGLQNE